MVRILLATALSVCLLAHRLHGQQAQLAPSPSVFAVLAAINAAGYEADSDSLTNHALRAAVRNRILASNPPVLADLKKFYQEHKATDETAELSQYISFALVNKGPPSFGYKLQLMQRPPEVIALNGFEKLLKRLWEEADMETLWTQSQPMYEEVLQGYHEQVRDMVMQCSAYLRSPAEGYFGETFQIIPALLAAPNQIHLRSYGTEFFIVLTPSVEPHVDDIRYAYLQFLLDPLFGLQVKRLEAKKDIGELAKGSGILPDYYKNDFRMLATKCLIRAVEARLSPLKQREGMVEEAMREGYILTAFFYEQLPAYEKQDASMRFYLGDMIDALDPVKESARIAEVQFLEQMPVRTAKVTDAERRLQAQGPYRKLEEAENFYGDKRFDEARAAYGAVIDTSTDPMILARAYYGLARIAARSSDPDTAERLFLKTLELEPDPRTKAWTHVYLARLYKAMTQPDWEKVYQHFEAALNVEGASKAARDIAETGVKEARQEVGRSRD